MRRAARFGAVREGQEIMKRKALRAAFPHTLPVLTGYAFLGLAYGILMQSAGFPFWYPALISLVVYAGSMQYAAVPLLGAAFDPAGAFFLTLMVNARHLFYGVSMLEPYRAAGKKTPYLVFAMSDETFSVNVSACPPEEMCIRDSNRAAHSRPLRIRPGAYNRCTGWWCPPQSPTFSKMLR